MPRSWASSPDLHLDVDLSRPRGRRAALEHALRDAIRVGRLAPGTVLPSSRGLARDLGLSRGTVLEAYAQLLAEGYLLTRPGAVTLVADTDLAAETPARTTRPRSRVRTDLRPGLLDLASTFPRRAWLRAVRSVLQSAPDEVFDYGDPRGRPELRAALAAYLARARGVVASPEQIVICAGFAHGLSLLCEVLRGSGIGTIAMEDPCLPVHRGIVGEHGMEVAPMPVDDHGARVDALEHLDARAAVLTPAHQYPTGVTLQPARRMSLVAWARSCGGVVVEDDYDGEFRYDRQPVGAVQGLAPDHVIYAGTASKTLAPGVRIGWLVLPPRLVGPVVAAKRVDRGGSTPPALDQLALAQLLGDGRFDLHLRRLRAAYRSRRDRLMAALGQLPGLEPAGISAGLHLLLTLPGELETENEIRAAAEARGLALGYLAPHWHDASNGRPGVIVGFARPAATAFDDAVRELVAVLGSLQGSKR